MRANTELETIRTQTVVASRKVYGRSVIPFICLSEFAKFQPRDCQESLHDTRKTVASGESENFVRHTRSKDHRSHLLCRKFITSAYFHIFLHFMDDLDDMKLTQG
jgi:hypothetical protein